MSKLELLNYELLEKTDNLGDPVIVVAQTRTLTMLRTLDQDRKVIILKFLSNSKLDSFLLVKASMVDFNLAHCDLNDFNLSEANLSGANLQRAYLNKANLCGARLCKAQLPFARLMEANLSGADLSGANFFLAHLEDSNLSDSDLSGAYMSEAKLEKTDLHNARLFSVEGLTDKQLAKAKTLDSVILENGLKYDPAFHTEITRLRKEAGLDQ